MAPSRGTSTLDAVVIGSCPNGLAAAVALARAGRSVAVYEGAATVGGGLRSAQLTDDGVIYDVCSAVHPFAVASPFFQELPLDNYGVTWLQPDVAYTQPLDDGRAGVAFRDIERTAELLGADAKVYKRLVGPLAEHWSDLAEDVLAPMVHLPKHPITLARFGIPGLLPSSVLAGRFKTDEARGLLAGAAAHATIPLTSALTGAVGLLFMSSAHAGGWPIVAGGSQKLADALAALLVDLGGEIHLDSPVSSLADLPTHRVAFFDTSPGAMLSISGSRLGGRYARRLKKFRHGAAAFKVDYVLSEPVPWADEWSAAAGTVHVGGTFAETKQAEAEVGAGRHPEKPFVLVAQPSALDASRTPDSRQVLWAYTHVPPYSGVDMTDAIERQLERFAPGFRDCVMYRRTTSPADFEEYNPNYVGGDFAGGTTGHGQVIRRPILSPDPYATPDPGIYLCSASTPPGAGVHGMAGFHAATSALNGPLA